MATFMRSMSWSGSEKFFSLPDQIRLIFASGNHLKRQLDFAIDSYRKHNYLTKAEVERMSGFYNVLGLPTRRGRFTSGHENLDQHLMQDHHDLSVFLIYILHAKEQQIEFEEHDLKGEFIEVKLSLICLLDQFETTLTRRQVPITHHVDSSVIPRGLRNFKGSKLRYWRDFLMLRDTRLFVKEVCKSYETLFHHIL